MTEPALSTIQLTVEGMTCDGCAGKVRDALAKTDGITSADVDHASGKVVVHPDGSVDHGTLEFAIDAAIFDLGYTIV